jgi:hypothetical protein
VLAAAAATQTIGQDNNVFWLVMGGMGVFAGNMILTIIAGRRAARNEVSNLKRDLGVPQAGEPGTHPPTPDISKMERQIGDLEKKLTTVQNELTKTLEERDTARGLLGKQVEKNAQDNVNAQEAIDKLQRKGKEQDDLIASQENTIGENERRFQLYELSLARLEGRLDEREKQEQFATSIKAVTDSFLTVLQRMAPTPQPGVSN